jgi:epoxyqueuosine reductase
MDEHALRSSVLAALHSAGFPLAGMCSARLSEDEGSHLQEFLRLGLHGSLGYLGRTPSLRASPSALFPWARGVFCVAMPYNTSMALSAAAIGEGRCWVSRYAWGRDYHKVLRARLRPAARLLGDAGVRARICVDSAPLLERALAVRAGLGFIGKNGCLIHPELGSYLFLGEIVTDLELAGGDSVEDGCGSCSLCLRGCPAGAFAGPRLLDARRCLSTWTIEWRGEFPPEAPALGGHLFGCDRCQEVCPHNRHLPLSEESEFRAREGWFAPDPQSAAAMTEGEWDARTCGSALRRARHDGLVRNARRILEEREFTTETQRRRGRS